MCYLDACPNPGIWQPILNLKSRSDGTPTSLRFKTIRACDEHKSASTVDSFLSDEGFDKLARHMRDAGKSIPQRKLTTLDWEQDPTIDPSPPPSPQEIPAIVSEEENLPF